jgi:hypothetical protein
MEAISRGEASLRALRHDRLTRALDSLNARALRAASAVDTAEVASAAQALSRKLQGEGRDEEVPIAVSSHHPSV